MTDQQHPITLPPEELRRQWQSECPFFVISVQREDWMIDRAAQWGADQELEACCEWTQSYAECGDALRLVRRPKPPSLKEQALEALERQSIRSIPSLVSNDDCDTIRRALEALPND
jgi:hypothetical protein